MAKDETKNSGMERVSVFQWKGLLSDSESRIRIMILVVLAAACVAMTFTQLGFVPIGQSQNPIAYAVALLQPVVLCALLYGPALGGILGLFAGFVLFEHASVAPLNFYEGTFVNALTSIVALGLCGLLAGLLFARVLRNNPKRVRRVVHYVLTCLVVSAVYALLFTISAYGIALGNLVDSLNENYVDADIEVLAGDMLRTLFRAGSPIAQALVDAILMVVVCILGDLIARKAIGHRDRAGLRNVFGAWLGVVVLLAFMITATGGFAAVTTRELETARDAMESEATYLHNQLEYSTERQNVLWDLLDSTGIDYADLDVDKVRETLDSMSFETLIVGYSEPKDGLVLVAAPIPADYTDSGVEEHFILVGDTTRYGDRFTLEDYFGIEASEAVIRSCETNELQRIVYDQAGSVELASSDGLVFTLSQMQYGYLYAMERNDYVAIVIQPASMVFADRPIIMAGVTLSALVLLLAVFFLVSRLLNVLVASRIDKTNVALERITEGDLEARVEDKGTREFRSLASGINTTVDTLKNWIAEAESRMDAELATAKAIQESALPRTFPPFPDIMRFDIYASMNPAREVGGDFYDFFLIGEEHTGRKGKLGFLIADVSGKGVPAALFMMEAKTQLRSYMESGMELGESVENANRHLCDGNTAGMFVTLWAGILDYETGHVEYVNAGHNPPLLWQKDKWIWLKDKSGLPLGLFDNMQYKAFSLDCGIGDQFFLYTDGVTEAMSTEGALFGEDQLYSVLEDNFTAHPRMLVETIRKSVAAHAEGALQSDDITTLSLEFGVPPELTAILTVKADVDELPRVNEFIHTELDRRLCPMRIQNKLDIAVEELFVNVAHYAYPDATPANPGRVRVSYSYNADPPFIEVSIIDEGIPYDPLAKPDAVTPDNIEDVPIGGLGILMAKRSVDEMSYERVDGSNVVTIVKKW